MQYLIRPAAGFVCVTQLARIRDFVFFSHVGSEDLEVVSTNLDLCNRRLNGWHVTPNAWASRTSIFMVSEAWRDPVLTIFIPRKDGGTCRERGRGNPEASQLTPGSCSPKKSLSGEDTVVSGDLIVRGQSHPF
jgi:hypothetical protein